MSLNYWPRTGRSYKIPFTPLPPQAGAPMVLCLFYFSWWTVGLSLIVCGVFAYASFKGRTVPWAIKRFRSYMRGGVLKARPRIYRERFMMDQTLGEVDFALSADEQRIAALSEQAAKVSMKAAAPGGGAASGPRTVSSRTASSGDATQD